MMMIMMMITIMTIIIVLTNTSNIPGCTTSRKCRNSHTEHCTLLRNVLL